MISPQPALFALGITLVAALGAGCVGSPEPEFGRTLFLGDLPAIPGRPGMSVAQVDDSYWSGDGVAGSPSIRLDLSEQRGYFYKGGVLVGETPLSTGDARHPTPTGTFRITEKSPDHRSNLYGDYVDAGGNVVVADVDTRVDPRPPGTRYRGASMPYFLRFNGGVGMHAGYLPGYPASHGCVRMPDHMAWHFYHNSRNGTPVSVVY